MTRFAFTTLVVRDYDEAIAWFTSRLGFLLTEDSPRGNGKRWVTLRPPGGEAGLLLARGVAEAQLASVGAQTGGRVAFFLHTDDFDRDHAVFLAKGVEFTEEPRNEEYGKVAVFVDLYGNKWDLIGRKRITHGEAPFTLAEGVPLLERTPVALRGLLSGLPNAWTRATEGADSWSPYDIVGHLIHGERADWMPRVEHILAHGDTTPFAPFDREAMLREPTGRTIEELLQNFASLRAASLGGLRSLKLTTVDLDRCGLHPALGPVTLGQLLATWVAHDLDHLAQISRVMARRYGSAVGPWRAYLPLIGRR
jgi:catechol 2,3-dioxygenase-like lactoylglutathione lyase family enzyme